MRDAHCIQFLNMSMYVTVESTKGHDMATTKSSLPTLAAILACREASPGIMEHEKTILVMKEHDYAKTPDMTQLAPLFRLLTEEAVTNDNRKGFRKGSSELFNVRQTLAHVRTSLVKDDGAVSNHLNKMVSLQSTLIHELQEQVFYKGLETTTIKREKEQLEARLERMERRLSVLQKRSKRKEEQEPTSSVTTPTSTTPINTAKPEQITRLARSESVTNRNSRSRSSSTETVSRRNSRTGSVSNSLEVTHRAAKRSLDGGSTLSVSKKTRSSVTEIIEEHLTTTQCYDGLGLINSQATMQLCSIDDTALNKEDFCEVSVKVPSWKISRLLPNSNNDNTSLVAEDISDESFIKRHSKPESEEKRRKRWDAQRMRERLHHDQLLKRYMMKEGCSPQTADKKKEKLTTFYPKLDEIQEIHISDSLIVNAFGRPIPIIKPTVFRLANFDPTAAKSSRGKLKGKPTQNSGTVSVKPPTRRNDISIFGGRFFIHSHFDILSAVTPTVSITHG